MNFLTLPVTPLNAYSRFGMEESKTLETDASSEECVSKSELVHFNVGGKIFVTTEATLSKRPNTRLGDPNRRANDWNEELGAYFYDRNQACFDALLLYYQTTKLDMGETSNSGQLMTGTLLRPEHIPLEVFIDELEYFEIEQETIIRLLENEGVTYRAYEPIFRMGKWQKSVWELFTAPESSKAARAVGFFSVFAICVATISFCMETMPEFAKYRCSRLHIHIKSTKAKSCQFWLDPFYVVEVICMSWFTIEFVVCFVTAPSKFRFIKRLDSWIDLIAILPFYVDLIVAKEEFRSLIYLRVVLLVRVFRVLKLSRHSKGLRILLMTLKESIRELMLLGFFIGISIVVFSSAIYFAENKEKDSKFLSIPHTFWYVLVTMTTVGYGDMVPNTLTGKLLGSTCALAGLLLIALPVPVIVENFKKCYRQEQKSQSLLRKPTLLNEMMRTVETNDRTD